MGGGALADLPSGLEKGRVQAEGMEGRSWRSAARGEVQLRHGPGSGWENVSQILISMEETQSCQDCFPPLSSEKGFSWVCVLSVLNSVVHSTVCFKVTSEEITRPWNTQCRKGGGLESKIRHQGDDSSPSRKVIFCQLFPSTFLLNIPSLPFKNMCLFSCSSVLHLAKLGW